MYVHYASCIVLFFLSQNCLKQLTKQKKELKHNGLEWKHNYLANFMRIDKRHIRLFFEHTADRPTQLPRRLQC